MARGSARRGGRDRRTGVLGALATIAALFVLVPAAPVAASAPVSGWADITTGTDHACAVTAADTVVCWGLNANGQVGDTTTTTRTRPVAVSGLTSVAGVSAGGNRACARTFAGTAWCWGEGSDGRLGNAGATNSTVPVPVTGLTGVTALSVGGTFACAVVAGTVKCWGTGYGVTPTAVSGIGSAVEVSVGNGHACALLSTGGARCWGTGTAGQLGNGSSTTSATPVTPTGLGSGVRSIAAGGTTTCAVLTTGAASCWGNGMLGQLGNATAGNAATPQSVAALGTAAARVSVGTENACAIRTDRSLWCWGTNEHAAVGDGSDRTAPLPVTAVATFDGPTATVSVGHRFVCALARTGRAACWGNNGAGQLGVGFTPLGRPAAPVDGVTDPTHLSVGARHGCEIEGDGTLRCWGAGASGQLGNASTTTAFAAVPVTGGGTYSSIGAALTHTCAVTTTGDARCWGTNQRGVLGDGTTADSLVPVDVVGLAGTTAAIDAGTYHSCAVTVTGAARCWGANAGNALGNASPTFADSSVPVDVVGLGSDVTSLAVGTRFSCAVQAGAAKCWGTSSMGVLGNNGGASTNQTVNVTGLGSGVASVVAGDQFACALTTAGAVLCWGAGADGQLGRGTAVTSGPAPAPVVGLSSGVTALTAGASHACALLTDGSLRCWGLGTSGQLGTGALVSALAPVTVTTLAGPATAVSAGSAHTCASSGGAVQCWGSAEDGQLGRSPNTYRPVALEDPALPVDAPGFTTGPADVAVAAGEPATFTATSTDPIRWERSDAGGAWTTIDGATGPTYSLLPTATDHGARFRAVATGPTATATSAPARLAVLAAPTITVVPLGTSAAPGIFTTRGFSAAATGSPAPLPTWQTSIDGGVTWTDVGGVPTNTSTGTTTTSAITLSAGTTLQVRYVRVRFTNDAGAAASDPVRFVTTDPPTVTAQPVDASAAAGGTATFTAAATALADPTVQWAVSSDFQLTWTDLVGATAATVTVPVAEADDGHAYRATFRNGAGTAVSQAAFVSVAGVSNPPQVTVQPTVQAGSSTATFRFGATGSAPMAYQWQRSNDGGTTWFDVGSNSAALLPALVINITSADDTARFRVRLDNAAGTATSNEVVLSVVGVPAITAQPQSTTATVGSTATFTVTAVGQPTATAQWYRTPSGGSATAIAGATSSSYTTPPVTAADQGAKYHVVLTNTKGATTSSQATLTVLVPPVVTSHPQNKAVTAGQSASFTSTATGTPTPTRRWERSTDGGATWTTLAGTGTTLTVSTTASDDGNRYRAVYTNTAGTTTSNEALLTVGNAPVIVSQPQDQALDEGTVATFSVTATSNAGTPTYQWQRCSAAFCAYLDIAGATGPTYSTPPVTGAMNDAFYRVRVTNTAGTTTSTAARLTVDYAPQITTQPADADVVQTTAVTFAAAAVGRPTPTVRWQRSDDGGATWADVAGATSPTLSLPTTGADDDGARFRAVFTNRLGDTPTTPALLTVRHTPTIVTPPQDVTVDPGGTATFSVVATSNSGAATYQWTWCLPAPSGVCFDIAGATGTSYTTPPLTDAEHLRRYRVRVTNGVGDTVSPGAVVSVDAPPAVTTDPTAAVVPAGDAATFSATATGRPAPDVQWQRSDDGGATWADVAGATTATLTLADLGSADDGALLRAVFTNHLGSATTTAATLSIDLGGIEVVVPDGGTARTGVAPSATDVLVTSVTVPLGGTIRLTEQPTTVPLPRGYAAGAENATLTLPAQTAGAPAVITFGLAAALVAPGSAGNVLVWRDGVLVGNCVGASAATTASPDPCVRRRTTLSPGGAQITVLATTGGTFTFGRVTATVPGAPTIGTALGEAKRITVSWTPPASDGGADLSGYQVRATPVAGQVDPVSGLAPTVRSANAAGTATSVSFSAASGIAYDVTVQARNGVVAAYGPASGAVTVQTPGLPATPRDVVAAAGIRSAVVSWSPPVTDGGSPVTAYRVAATSGSGTVSTKSVYAPATTATVTGLANDTTYTFTVVAITAAGTSPATTPTPAVATPALPGVPGSVDATAGGHSVTVTWEAPPTVPGYPVTSYRATVTGTRPDGSTHTVTKSVAGSAGSPPGTTAVVTGLVAGVTYRATVSATSAVGTTTSAAPGPVASPFVGLSVADVTVTEGTGSATSVGTITVTLRLSGATTVPVSATVSFVDGTTDAADHLDAPPRVVTIAAGATSATTKISVRRDTLVEPDEWLSAALSDVLGATATRAAATITIRNDD